MSPARSRLKSAQPSTITRAHHQPAPRHHLEAVHLRQPHEQRVGGEKQRPGGGQRETEGGAPAHAASQPGMCPIWASTASARGQFVVAGRPGQHRQRDHARRAPGGQVMRAVADHRHAPRLQPRRPREGQQRAGLGLGAIARIAPGDEIEIRRDPGIAQMRVGAKALSFVTTPSTSPRARRPVQQRGQRHRRGERRPGGCRCASSSSAATSRSRITRPTHSAASRLVPAMIGLVGRKRPASGSKSIASASAAARSAPAPGQRRDQLRGPGAPGGVEIEQRAVLVEQQRVNLSDRPVHHESPHVQCDLRAARQRRAGCAGRRRLQPRHGAERRHPGIVHQHEIENGAKEISILGARPQVGRRRRSPREKPAAARRCRPARPGIQRDRFGGVLRQGHQS